MTATTAKRTQVRDQWVSDFEMLEQSLNGHNPEPVASLRRKAIEQFKTLGFPTTRNEEWKYTSLRSLLEIPFQSVAFAGMNQVSKADIEGFSLKLDAYQAVLVNGFFAPELSNLPENTEKVFIQSLSDAIASGDQETQDSLGQIIDTENRALVALNTAFFRDGIVLKLKRSATLDKPLHILNILDGSASDRVAQQRNLFLLEENAEAKIILSTHSLGNHHTWNNLVNEGRVDQNGRLEIITLQEDHSKASQICFSQFEQAQNSTCSATTLTLDGQLVRNDLNVYHTGQHCETHMHGLYLTNGNMHVDNHTQVDHAQPNCYSNEVYKGVLGGSSTGVFNGKVMVHQDAQKTNAFQSNKNLLLSPNATINTKPQLEIFADDVKCSHGATTGRLDETAMFYLRARGIPKSLATAILTNAFAADVLENLSLEDLKEEYETKISERIYAAGGE